MTDYRNTQLPAESPLHEENARYQGLVRFRLSDVAKTVTQPYQNFVLSAVNDHCVRMAVMEGEYRWHRHPESDELFVVLEGQLEIDLSATQTILVGPGEAFLIPAGTAHRTRAKVRTVNLCFEDQSAYTNVEFLEEAPA